MLSVADKFMAVTHWASKRDSDASKLAPESAGLRARALTRSVWELKAAPVEKPGKISLDAPVRLLPLRSLTEPFSRAVAKASRKVRWRAGRSGSLSVGG